ncbi:MAG: DUF4861 domain-containing protein [Prevotellaceae bacterium]|jgi:hypothetical protein|nr:DUF4861 domain-containing protein [Prevotellaceae bacterium]
MKKLLFFIFSAFLFASCSGEKTITVTNPTGVDRVGEMVEVKASDLGICCKASTYILTDEAGEEIAYQLVYNGKEKPQSLIFQASVSANSTSVYVLSSGKPAKVKAKTFARYVPERKDDFAWENDLAAYRVYGPALAKENPSNGVDLWLKRSDDLIVDEFYHDELNHGLSYHVDHGKGLDCYKVGHTLGAGGIAPYADGVLYVGDHYTTQKTLDNGPLRSTFVLTYDSVKVGNDYYNQTITISIDAGTLLNKALVSYSGKAADIELAAGIYLHPEKGNLQVNVENGIAAYAENAVSDAGIPSGRNYAAAYVPEKVNDAVEQDLHALLLTNYSTGNEFTYYFGGGWSKWGFPADEDWFNAVNTFAANKKNPLQVNVK